MCGSFFYDRKARSPIVDDNRNFYDHAGSFSRQGRHALCRVFTPLGNRMGIHRSLPGSMGLSKPTGGWCSSFFMAGVGGIWSFFPATALSLGLLQPHLICRPVYGGCVSFSGAGEGDQ
jgi:hypothetical protein